MGLDEGFSMFLGMVFFFIVFEDKLITNTGRQTVGRFLGL